MGSRRQGRNITPAFHNISGRSHRPRDDPELAVAGLSNKEIAARLVVSVHTVERHLKHAYAKLGIRSRNQLAAHIGNGQRS